MIATHLSPVNFKKKIPIAVVLFLSITICKAQDVILKKDNTKINAKIIEVGKTEIKYRYFDNPDGPIISIDKSELLSIKLDGKTDKTIVFKDDPMMVSNKAILDKNQVIKINMFSPLYGHTAVSYEWVQRPGLNWEVGASAIGLGYKGGIIKPTQLYGIGLRGGPKFLFGNTEDVEVDGVNYKFAHPLKGRYFKIEGFYNQFTRATNVVGQVSTFAGTTTPEDSELKIRFKTGGVNFIYGRQLIVGNAITLGYYAGLGYSMEDRTVIKSPEGYTDFTTSVGGVTDGKMQRYGAYRFKNNPVTFTSGITLGYIFGDDVFNREKYKRNTSPSRHSMN